EPAGEAPERRNGPGGAGHHRGGVRGAGAVARLGRRAGVPSGVLAEPGAGLRAPRTSEAGALAALLPRGARPLVPPGPPPRPARALARLVAARGAGGPASPRPRAVPHGDRGGGLLGRGPEEPLVRPRGAGGLRMDARRAGGWPA